MGETHSGVIIRRTKGFYYLRDVSGDTVECKIKGQLFKDSRFDNQAAVGDRVVYQKNETDDVGLIVGIEPRKGFLSRSRVGKEAEQVIAANVDYLLIVTSVRNPAFRFNLVNRMLVAASVGQVTPVLIINKTDLAAEAEIQQLVEPFNGLDLMIVFSSIRDSDRDPRLLELLSRHVCVLCGQSGVGKSSLLNRYFPLLAIRIGEVSTKTGKGAHTTTYSVMHRIAENGYVIDTPGIREFGLWEINRENLGDHYPFFRKYHHSCKHRNCRHVHEPGCAVKKAVAAGEIHQVSYDGYLSIFESLQGP